MKQLCRRVYLISSEIPFYFSVEGSDRAAEKLEKKWDEEKRLRPFYDTPEYRKDLSEGIRLLKESVFKDPFNASMFHALKKERQIRIQWLRQEIDRWHKIRAERMIEWLDAEKTISDIWLEKWQKYLKDAEREYKRFIFYVKLCKGKATLNSELPLEQAREFPIGELMPTEPVSRSGGRQTFLCPLHEEETGSFVWYVEKNYFHCFGCGAHGDVIELAQKLYNLGFVEAVKKLTNS